MADTRFFKNKGPFSLEEIVSLTGCKVPSRDGTQIDQSLLIKDIAPLNQAGAGDLSFFSNSKYLPEFKNSKAEFCVVEEKFAEQAPKNMILLISSNPYKSYAQIAIALYKEEEDSITAYIAESSKIADSAFIGDNCYIGENVVIEANAQIGNNCYIAPNSVISRGVILGDKCYIGSNVTITHSIIKDNVIIHNGARIGQDGFGYASDHTGHLKVPQLGRVLIGAKVEIGANTTIDRGSSQDTIIGEDSKIDNLVQIGHNVELGRGCIIVSQVGIAGSTKLGDGVVLGGKVGVAGHLTIGSGAQVAAGSGVTKNVGTKEVVGGYPAVPIRQWHKQTIFLKNANK